MTKDIVIVGGGSAGLAAALGASRSNLDILVIEREKELGGILNQCIHNGFGLHIFKEELTGPEYAAKYIDSFLAKKISFLLHTTVIEIEKTDIFKITVSSLAKGLTVIYAKSLILSSGCYERTRGSILLPGERPKGIVLAGSAQRYLDIDGYLVGKRVFILGSGDIGLIMARRMVLQGAQVLGVAEIMPYSNGLTRNIVQCLNDFDIPLFLSHTVTNIIGKDNLEKIVIQKVDKDLKPIINTEKTFSVDTLLLSIGLIPDVSLVDSLGLDFSQTTKSVIVDQNYETNVSGLFVCGNALHVHDLVDYVTIESEKAGFSASAYVLGERKANRNPHKIITSDLVKYVVPQLIDFSNLENDVELSFRVTKKIRKSVFQIVQNNKIIQTQKANYSAPAEMEKMTLKIENLIDSSPLSLVVSEVEK